MASLTEWIISRRNFPAGSSSASPEVLLCDEPTGALDVKTGVRVLEALVEINTRYGSTTLIVTHNADVARLAGRVVRFVDGRIRAIDVNAKRVPPSELVW